MNRIDELFRRKSEGVLSVYFTAGYPKLDSTGMIIESLGQAGADLLEVGIPFSDPMVDGPVIQESNKTALENGMNMKLLFEQISEVRKKSNIPIILMGYLNPVFHYGIEKFCRSCKESGVDGAILPDLPLEVYLQNHKALFEKNSVYNVFLVSPTTSKQRLEKILPEARGFVYMVSSSSTTGNPKEIREHLNYTDLIRKIRPDIPVMVGFGISNRERFRMVCNYANGGIIGTAFIRSLDRSDDLKRTVGSFIHSIKNG